MSKTRLPKITPERVVGELRENANGGLRITANLFNKASQEVVIVINTTKQGDMWVQVHRFHPGISIDTFDEGPANGVVDEGDNVKYARGVRFTFGENDMFRYWTHTDMHGWMWQLYQHKRGHSDEMNRTWLANVSEKGRHGAARMLNTAVGDGDGGHKQKDPLYDLNAHDLDTMLLGMAELINKGEWPKDKE